MTLESILLSGLSMMCTVPMANPLGRAQVLMERERTDVLLVTDHCGSEGQHVAGLLTIEDIDSGLRRHGQIALAMPVERFTSRFFIMCDKAENLHAVLEKSREWQARYVVVMDREQYIGLVPVDQIVSACSNFQSVA